MNRFRTASLLACLLLLSGLLTGCTKQDWADLRDIAMMWARAHDLVEDNGKPNYLTIGTRALGGSTGDPAADAAIDAGQVVNNYAEAEKQAEDGWNQRNPNQMGKAIAMRPGEFRYRNQRGAILVSQGQEKEAEKDFADADALARKYGKASQVRNLENRQKSLSDEWSRVTGGAWVPGKPLSPGETAAMRRNTQANFKVNQDLFALTGDPKYLEIANGHQERLKSLR